LDAIINMAKFKLTLGTTEYENVKLKYGKNIRNENGFDIATLNLDDTSLFPDTVTAGTAVQLEVAEKGEDYPDNPMFKGVCRFPIVDISGPPKGNTLMLSCLGAGYGLNQMLVAEEYGVQSRNSSVDTIKEILVDVSHGIITNWVNLVMDSVVESGFAYDVTDVDAITGTINYIPFPYKPAMAAINDVVDVVTALKAGGAGPHWIVTTDDHLHMKLISSTQAGEWDRYYGASQANATLTYGLDYERANFEKIGPESNYVVYHGVFRKPPRDVLTESLVGWDDSDVTLTLTAGGGAGEPADAVAGTYMLKAASEVDGTCYFWYDFPVACDFTNVGSVNNPPTVNFLLACNDISDAVQIGVNLYTNRGVDYFGYVDAAAASTLQTELSEDAQFQLISIPIGPYAELYYNRNVKYHWTASTGSADWADITGVEFQFDGTAERDVIFIDDLRFEGLLTRVALNSGITPYNMKLITDNVGKDDSLKDGDDSGTMAQLAYAELLRSSKTSYVGWARLKGILPEALPGQLFYLQQDLRTMKIVHEIDQTGFYTTLYLTDDLTNGRARMRYEDLNKVYAGVRPEFQDRQATSIKAGTLDIDVPRLTVDYV